MIRAVPFGPQDEWLNQGPIGIDSTKELHRPEERELLKMPLLRNGALLLEACRLEENRLIEGVDRSFVTHRVEREKRDKFPAGVDEDGVEIVLGSFVERRVGADLEVQRMEPVHESRVDAVPARPPVPEGFE